MEDIGAVHQVVNGVQACKIGYVPRVLLYNGQVDKLNNQYSRTVELYAISCNPYKVAKDAKLRGMAAAVVDDAAHSEHLL